MISYALVMILLLLSIIVSIGNLMDIGSQVQTFYNGPFKVRGAAAIVNSNFESMQKSVFRTIASDDRVVKEQALKDAQSCASNIQANIPIIKENFLGDKAIVERLQADLTELAPHREHVLELASTGRDSEAAEYMEANNIAIIRKAQVELDAIMEFANNKGGNLAHQSAIRANARRIYSDFFGRCHPAYQYCVRRLYYTQHHQAGQ